MLPELEPYFAKYYDRWLNYSQYICTRLGIRREAYDIMADVLVEFCRKSDEALADLLIHEQHGKAKLFQFVRKAIQCRAIDFIRQRHIALCDMEKHMFHLSVSEDDQSNEISDEVREAEAMLRDDSLVIPVATSAKPITLPSVNFMGWTDNHSGKVKLHAYYRARINVPGKKGYKSIARTSRSATMAAVIQYQMSQNFANQTWI